MKPVLRTIVLLGVICLPLQVFCTDYKASMFGIKSNGTTLNTRAIQKAIDYISEQGGGRLVFYVGRYLTGSIQLKSNVSLKLMEGAILVGSTSIYDYMVDGKPRALVFAKHENNIGISGKGVIEGNGKDLIKNLFAQKKQGLIDQARSSQPALLHFDSCEAVQVDSVQLWKAAGAVQIYRQCQNISIDRVGVKSIDDQLNTGAILEKCSNILIKNTYVETIGKSLVDGGQNENILIENSIDAKGTPLHLQ
ncbi:hypothetical protein GCM10023231_37180 [Olivibacter ginsenosidimutans]|uniref:Glycoside hydrolase n=1 Tax=Olivibacter ginsenosidimutans TaxID=1176537 RepID=A0ABP9C4Z3_9SPHI